MQYFMIAGIPSAIVSLIFLLVHYKPVSQHHKHKIKEEQTIIDTIRNDVYTRDILQDSSKNIMNKDSVSINTTVVVKKKKIIKHKYIIVKDTIMVSDSSYEQ